MSFPPPAPGQRPATPHYIQWGSAAPKTDIWTTSVRVTGIIAATSQFLIGLALALTLGGTLAYLGLPAIVGFFPLIILWPLSFLTLSITMMLTNMANQTREIRHHFHNINYIIPRT
ncbi:MAG: hypothetical protein LBN10_03015 [Propionibacteriaceae bacterium]|jgi:hypothetical protein|nr:hypothetical protein [Propionibacteriaceae bacterium]